LGIHGLETSQHLLCNKNVSATKMYPGKCSIMVFSKKYFAFFCFRHKGPVIIKHGCRRPGWTFAVSTLRSSPRGTPHTPPSKVDSRRTVERNEIPSCKRQQKNPSGKDVISTGTNERLSQFCCNNLTIKVKTQSKLTVYVAVGEQTLNIFIFGSDT